MTHQTKQAQRCVRLVSNGNQCKHKTSNDDCDCGRHTKADALDNLIAVSLDDTDSFDCDSEGCTAKATHQELVDDANGSAWFSNKCLSHIEKREQIWPLSGTPSRSLSEVLGFDPASLDDRWDEDELSGDICARDDCVRPSQPDSELCSNCRGFESYAAKREKVSSFIGFHGLDGCTYSYSPFSMSEALSELGSELSVEPGGEKISKLAMEAAVALRKYFRAAEHYAK